MSTDYAPGLHVVTGQPVSTSAYDRWVGRWSRLFVPSLLAAAQVSPGCTVLDVATGTGEAAAMALSIVGSSGIVVGADIAPEMLEAARIRLAAQTFRPAAADGQALPLGMTASTRSLVSSVCSSFLIPLLGCWSSAAFFVQEAGRPYACTPRQIGRRCGAFLPKRSAGSFPSDGMFCTCHGHWPTRCGSKSCSPMQASGTFG